MPIDASVLGLDHTRDDIVTERRPRHAEFPGVRVDCLLRQVSRSRRLTQHHRSSLEADGTFLLAGSPRYSDQLPWPLAPTI